MGSAARQRGAYGGKYIRAGLGLGARGGRRIGKISSQTRAKGYRRQQSGAPRKTSIGSHPTNLFIGVCGCWKLAEKSSESFYVERKASRMTGSLLVICLDRRHRYDWRAAGDRPSFWRAAGLKRARPSSRPGELAQLVRPRRSPAALSRPIGPSPWAAASVRRVGRGALRLDGPAGPGASALRNAWGTGMRGRPTQLLRLPFFFFFLPFFFLPLY
jgi:hypothetical protein